MSRHGWAGIGVLLYCHSIETPVPLIGHDISRAQRPIA